MPQANPRAIRLINALQAEGNEAEQNAAFADLMREKVAVALDARKVALTPEMFGEGTVPGKSRSFAAVKKSGDTPIPYDGNGVKAGVTYSFETGPVKVAKIDNNLVIYEPLVSQPGREMRHQLKRMPIEDFEDRLLTEGTDLSPKLGQHGVTTGKSYKMKKFSAMHNRDEEVYAKVIKQSRNGPGGPVIIHYTIGNNTRELEMPATRFISKIIK